MALVATSNARSAETIPVRMIDGPPTVEVQLGAIKANVSDVSHSRLLHGDSLWLHPANSGHTNGREIAKPKTGLKVQPTLSDGPSKVLVLQSGRSADLELTTHCRK